MKLYNSKLKLKITEETSEKLVSLPIHPNLTDSDVKRVIKLTNQFSKN
jgi:dTDP-4-amino-4,6-dideoxygalactose transaminase